MTEPGDLFGRQPSQRRDQDTEDLLDLLSAETVEEDFDSGDSGEADSDDWGGHDFLEELLSAVGPDETDEERITRQAAEAAERVANEEAAKKAEKQKEEKIKQKLRDLLIFGHNAVELQVQARRNKALILFEEHRMDVDFSKIILDSFRTALKSGEIKNAFWIKDNFDPGTIDLWLKDDALDDLLGFGGMGGDAKLNYQGYKNVVLEGFHQALESGNIEEAITLYSRITEPPEKDRLRTVDGYSTYVPRYHGQIDFAKAIEDKDGNFQTAENKQQLTNWLEQQISSCRNLDLLGNVYETFKSILGKEASFENMLREKLNYWFLRNRETTKAIKVITKFEDRFDFTAEIKEAFVFLLSIGAIGEVLNVKAVGDQSGIIWREVCKKSSDEIKGGFKFIIEDGNIESAIKIQELFDSEELEGVIEFDKKDQAKVKFVLDNNILGIFETRTVLEHYDELSQLKKKERLARIAELVVPTWPELDQEIYATLASEVDLKTVWRYLNRHDRHHVLQFMPELLAKIPVETQIAISHDRGRPQKVQLIKHLLLQTAADTGVDYDGNDSRASLSSTINNFQEAWLEKFIEQGYFDNIQTFRKEVAKKRRLTPEIHEALERLQTTNIELYNYIESMIGHPTVDISAAIEFATDFERFSQRGDKHANGRLQEELNPAQLCEVGDYNNRIDLRPDQVRQALIDGTIDAMSDFKPFKRDYIYEIKNKKARSIEDRLRKTYQQIDSDPLALLAEIKGQKDDLSKALEAQKNLYLIIERLDSESLLVYTKENAASLISGKKFDEREKADLLLRIGRAKNKTDLVKIWYRILQAKKITAAYLTKQGVAINKGQNLSLDDLSDAQKEKLQKYLKIVTESRKTQITSESVVITVEALPHSDPRFATIGDDTVCCMRFGTGKMSVYMVAPQCGAVVVSFRTPEMPEGHSRIAAQSILTSDKSIGINVNNLIPGRGNEDEVSLTKALGPGFLQREANQPNVISCDNVEGHKNFIQRLMKNDDQIMSDLYQKFFEEYRQAHPHLQGQQTIVGMGFSDYLGSLDRLPNNFAPQALLSYSDATYSEVYSLLPADNPTVAKKKGLQPLTWRESWPVAYAEETIYQQENSDMIEGLTTVQKILTASEMVSRREGVNNLNLGYYDNQGALAGYALGYIAKADRWDKESEQVIYVHDLAVMPKERDTATGGKLILGYLRNIQKDSRLKTMPITMRCRESTSYPIIQKHAERFGYRIAKDTERYVGSETLHELRLEPVPVATAMPVDV